ncbi:MAG: tyrosine-protein phosphatase [Aminipila sp.]
MVDIHSHILPGLDDGSVDLDTTIRMLQNAERCGTKAIIATPHYYRGYFENEYEDVVKLVEFLKGDMADRGMNMDIYPGQEVFLDKHTALMYKKGCIRGLNGSRYLLVEMPMQDYDASLLDVVYELRLLGAVPVLAHPERYTYIIDKVEVINSFVEEGCLFQINTGSITGIFGKPVQKAAKVLIENGLCNFVASDAHTNHKRCTGLSDAFEIVRRISGAAADNAIRNSELVLMNGDIECGNSRIHVKKSIFSFFK